LRRVDDLADAAGIGRTTLVAIETGRKVVTPAMYNALELTLSLPIGTMDSVLRGDIDAFPTTTPGYPPEVYVKETRDEREQDIMAVKGMSNEGKWQVIFGLREQAYDKTRGGQNDRRHSG